MTESESRYPRESFADLEKSALRPPLIEREITDGEKQEQIILTLWYAYNGFPVEFEGALTFDQQRKKCDLHMQMAVHLYRTNARFYSYARRLMGIVL